jgi:hypothetical protein
VGQGVNRFAGKVIAIAGGAGGIGPALSRNIASHWGKQGVRSNGAQILHR